MLELLVLSKALYELRELQTLIIAAKGFLRHHVQAQPPVLNGQRRKAFDQLVEHHLVLVALGQRLVCVYEAHALSKHCDERRTGRLLVELERCAHICAFKGGFDCYL